MDRDGKRLASAAVIIAASLIVAGQRMSGLGRASPTLRSVFLSV